MRLHTVRDASALLAISPDTLYRMIRAGRVHAVTLGRLVRVPSEELVRLSREGLSPSQQGTAR